MSEQSDSSRASSAPVTPSPFDTFEVPLSGMGSAPVGQSLTDFSDFNEGRVEIPREVTPAPSIASAAILAESTVENSIAEEQPAVVESIPVETPDPVNVTEQVETREPVNVTEQVEMPEPVNVTEQVETPERVNVTEQVETPEPASVTKQVETPKPVSAAVKIVVPASNAAPETIVDQPTTVPESAEVRSGFRALELTEPVQAAIESSGYTTPTDIQSQIIPHVLAGRDVLAQSQTGTGKTAAFALPILSNIDVGRRKPQVLVLAPTRELAIQVAASFQTYGSHIARFDVAAIYGGQGYDTQLRQLKRGVPVVVGTPGRVIDHIKRGTLDLSEIECLVLDEADEMLNMGFLDDVKFVLEQTPKQRQVALFSATLPVPIQKIAQQYLKDPVRITIKRKTMTAEATRQRAVVVAHHNKLEVLSRILEVEETDGVIIFTKTREATVNVAEHLSRQGFSAVALNGDMPQPVRERTIQQLKSGRLDVLVATDVAARGLDVSRISHVFNYDIPHDTESYIHRIGRTGRAGRSGEAIILLSNSQRYKLKHIERLTKQPIEVVQPPSSKDINSTRVERFKEQITAVADGRDLSVFQGILSEYAEESGKSMDVIAAALAELCQKGRAFFVEDVSNRNERNNRSRQDDRGNSQGQRRGQRDERSQSGDHDDRRSRAPRRAGRVESGMDRYRIEVGRDDGVMPGNIVGAVANEAGIEGQCIGPINIYDSYSTIDLPEGMPPDVHNILRAVRVAGKPLRLRKASEGDNHGPSSRPQGEQTRPRFARGGGKSSKGGKPGHVKKRRNRNVG